VVSHYIFNALWCCINVCLRNTTVEPSGKTLILSFKRSDWKQLRLQVCTLNAFLTLIFVAFTMFLLYIAVLRVTIVSGQKYCCWLDSDVPLQNVWLHGVEYFHHCDLLFWWFGHSLIGTEFSSLVGKHCQRH